MKKIICDMMDEAIEKVLCDAHAEFETQSGHISMSQVEQIDKLKEKLSDIITTHITENL